MAERLVEDSSAIPRGILALSSLLQRVVQLNDRTIRRPPPTHHPVWAFRVSRKPKISVGGYLEHIYRHADCSHACYIVAYVYLDRFTRRHAPVFIDSLSVHRLLITTMLIAVKFMDGIHYDNAYFAKMGGITLMEMNKLELNFLFSVDFDLNVTPTIFHSYYSLLCSEMYRLTLPPPPPRFLPFLTEEDSSSSQSNHLAI